MRVNFEVLQQKYPCDATRICPASMKRFINIFIPLVHSNLPFKTLRTKCYYCNYSDCSELDSPIMQFIKNNSVFVNVTVNSNP
jgi:hypothetical protein